MKSDVIVNIIFGVLATILAVLAVWAAVTHGRRRGQECKQRKYFNTCIRSPELHTWKDEDWLTSLIRLAFSRRSYRRKAKPDYALSSVELVSLQAYYLEERLTLPLYESETERNP